MDKRELTEKGKELAFLLRHDKKAFSKGLIDKLGWRRCEELCEKMKILYDELVDIFETDNKNRYEFNSTWTKIRARQGHSIPVDMSFAEYIGPKEFLYHGTDGKFIKAIRKNGIRKQTRQYVHLSPDIETAEKVGRRHGDHLYVIKIDMQAMMKDGIKIWMSTNGVYLVDYVDPKYFKEIKDYGCIA